MTLERVVRLSLLASVPFNVYGAYILAFPASSLGQLAELPPVVPIQYRAYTALLVFLAGVVYARLAIQRPIDGPIIGIFAIAKLCTFVTAVLFWLSAAYSLRLVAITSVDLVLGLLWLFWLFRMRVDSSNPGS